MSIAFLLEDLYLSLVGVGMVITARCGCGYVCEGLAFGAGMTNFQTHCAVPARCGACQRVVVIDDRGASGTTQSPASGRSRGSCPSCRGDVVAYAQQSDHRPAGSMTWRAPDGRQLVLPPSGNACPRCGTPRLSFSISMMFD